jgi:hypothetical protein
MGVFDGLSKGFGDFGRGFFNSQFGGGCPLCKRDGTLEQKQSPGGARIVCGGCGAVFMNVPFKGMKLLGGDRRYVDLTLPLVAWNLIRLLPEGDSLLSAYFEGNVGFYATSVGVVRAGGGKVVSLRYSEISEVSLGLAWSMSLLHKVLVLSLASVGVISAAVAGLYAPEMGVVALAVSGLLAAAAVYLSRREVYQFESDMFAKKERSAWRIMNVKSEEAKAFVSLIKEHLV